MKHFVKTSILFALLGLITTSCNRDKLDDFITTQDYGVANRMMSDAKDMVDLNFNSSAEARLSAPACDGATITIENSQFKPEASEFIFSRSLIEDSQSL